MKACIKNILLFIGLVPMSISAQVASCHTADFDHKVRSMLQGTAPVLDVDTLRAYFDDYILIDCRTENEYKTSHLSGSLQLHYRADLDQIDKLPKHKKVLVYCSIGKRSEMLAARLNARGFTAFNLYGGIFEWVNRNYPIVSWDDQTKSDRLTDVVHRYNTTWGKWIINNQINTKGFILYD